MAKLNIKLLAFSGAEKQFFENAKSYLYKILDKNKISFVNDNPDILFFLTGGSESQAINLSDKQKYYGIISRKEENAFAAAAETKAFLDNSGYCSDLVLPNEISTAKFLNNYYNIKKGLENLYGKRLGLIGESSNWLISSKSDSKTLKSKLGISLIKIINSKLFDYEKANTSAEFMSIFKNFNNNELQNASKVYTILKEIIKNEKLDAVTVECFPLVVEKSVTACLALTKLNSKNIPAGCEGDTTSISGIMLAQEVCGIIPWMANLAYIEDNKITFAHCTAPLNLISDVNITTHFETDKGTAINGKFKKETVTIFRTNSSLTKAFLTKGEIINNPDNSTCCRTQIEVWIPKKKARLLLKQPLGNHHLIIPGDFIDQFTLLFKLLKIEIL